MVKNRLPATSTSIYIATPDRNTHNKKDNVALFSPREFTGGTYPDHRKDKVAALFLFQK
jgi:hypothetical protein